MKQLVLLFSIQLLLSPSFSAQSEVMSGDPPKESSFTLKGKSGERLIEVRIYSKHNPDQPIHTTVWQRGSAGPVEFIWSDGEQTLTVGQAATEGGALRLAHLLQNAVDLYLDASIAFKKTNVELRHSAMEMMQDMNTIVQSGSAHYTDDLVFEGFSPVVRRQLELVGNLDWSNAEYAINGSSEQDKYLAIYRFVNTQVQTLKELVNEEVAQVAETTMLVPVNTEEQFLADRKEFFDENEYMYPLDLEADTSENEIDLEANAPERTEQGPKRKVRKRDAWLLQELGGINRKIDELGDGARNAEYENRLDALEFQLAEIRELLDEKINPIVPNTENPIADLSALTGRNITVLFAKNSVEVTPEFQLILNEVFVQLARNPKHKVLITGYADKTGDPDINMHLSEQRAKSVKLFFQRRGIAGERLLLNYFGDSRSFQRNPGERRVEIEWLTEG